MTMIDHLAAAAARGVQVTIITGPPVGQDVGLSWTFKDTNYGPRATFLGAGYSLGVQCCDGDFSHWWLKRHGEKIADGQDNGWEPDNFDVCLEMAEQALRADVRRRLAELRGRR